MFNRTNAAALLQTYLLGDDVNFNGQDDYYLYPEKYLEDLLFKKDRRYDSYFRVAQSPDGNDGEFIIRNILGHVVWAGRIVDGAITGDIGCYHNGELVLMVHLVNNVKHGEYSYYENGELVLSGFYYDGMQSGIATRVDLKSKRIYDVQYVGGQVKFELLDDDGEKTLIQRENGMIVSQSCYMIHNMNSIPQFCEEGYSLNVRNGKSTFFYITQSMVDDYLKEERTVERDIDYSQMIVYGEAGPYHNEVLYEGECDESFTDGLPRSGKGIEYFMNPSESKYDYKLYATFENDHVKDKGQYVDNESICICNGVWNEDGLQYITLFKDEEAVYRGTYSDWIEVYHVDHTFDSFNVLPYMISDIVIDNGVDIHSPTLDLSPFILARTIRIGDHCFSNANLFCCFHMPNLESIEIGSESFSKDMCGVPEQDEIDRSCVIAYCDQLQSVMIGSNCFSQYNCLVLKKVPSLKAFTLGKVSNSGRIDGFSFYHVKEVEIANLHSLETLILGDSSFMSASKLVVRNLCNLTEFHLGSLSFMKAQTATMIHLPLLKGCVFDDALITCDELFLTNVPNLPHITCHGKMTLTSLRSVHLINCSDTLRQCFSNLTPVAVAVIPHLTVFMIDPFKELHLDMSKSTISLSDAGDYWCGETDSNGSPCGSGRLVKENQVVQTCLIDDKWNGITSVYATDSFQEVFDNENESGLYVRGKRYGTFVNTELNGLQTFKSYLNDKLFPEEFDRDFNPNEWVIDQSVVQNCTDLNRSEISPMFFDCAVKTTLRNNLPLNSVLILYNNLLQSLVLQGCSCRQLKSIIISHCMSLNKILFKDNCFAEQSNNGCLWIDDCPLLESFISKGNSTCAYFTNLFLSNLPSLTKVTIGNEKVAPDGNGHFSACKRVVFKELEALKELTLGQKVMMEAKELRLRHLPKLRRVSIYDEALPKCVLVEANCQGNVDWKISHSLTSVTEVVAANQTQAVNNLLASCNGNARYVPEL